MNKLIYRTFSLLIFLLYSCGTGPWYIQKNLYKTYKEPVYENPSWNFKTNGYYRKLSDSTGVEFSKSVLVFGNKGYCTSLKYSKLQSLIEDKEPIELELDWWQVKNDSIIIENYGETKRLVKTLVWWHKGKILNDSIIEIAYQDDNYEYKRVKYKFIESDRIPKLINKARYFDKDWYLTKLNESRK